MTPAAVALSAVTLLGCGPHVTPDPKPSEVLTFASEEEAFAAAEDVYRSYNDALSGRRAGATAEDPEAYLTGAALESDVDTQDTLAANGLRAIGEAEVTGFLGETAELDDESTVTGLVCLDVSAVLLVDAAGTNVTPPERGTSLVQRVVFVTKGDSLLISNEHPATEQTC